MEVIEVVKETDEHESFVWRNIQKSNRRQPVFIY